MLQDTSPCRGTPHVLGRVFDVSRHTVCDKISALCLGAPRVLGHTLVTWVANTVTCIPKVSWRKVFIIGSQTSCRLNAVNPPHARPLHRQAIPRTCKLACRARIVSVPSECADTRPPKPTAALSPLLTTRAARSLAVAEEGQLFSPQACGVDHRLQQPARARAKKTSPTAALP